MLKVRCDARWVTVLRHVMLRRVARRGMSWRLEAVRGRCRCQVIATFYVATAREIVYVTPTVAARREYGGRIVQDTFVDNYYAATVNRYTTISRQHRAHRYEASARRTAMAIGALSHTLRNATIRVTQHDGSSRQAWCCWNEKRGANARHNTLLEVVGE